MKMPLAALISFFAFLGLCAACASFSPADSEANAGRDYKLVWADEFDKDGRPNPDNWDYERGFVRNDELQWYQPENAWCEGGMLIIEARRERLKNPDHKPRSRSWRQEREYSEYTSASLRTKDLHEWQYGRFEMRARIDTRPGLWPAFWTLGSARRWPGCGEIDIMEYYRGMLLANACWLSDRGSEPEWDDHRKRIQRFGDPEWPSEFHIWRMDWDEDEIRLYVDEELMNTIDVRKAVNHDGDRTMPFREPHYIIVNLAIGGTNGGDPSETEFPGRYEIDYIRVYQEKAEAIEGSTAR